MGLGQAESESLEELVVRTDDFIAEADRQFEHLKSVFFASMALYERRSRAHLFPTTSIWRFSRSDIVVARD